MVRRYHRRSRRREDSLEDIFERLLEFVVVIGVLYLFAQYFTDRANFWRSIVYIVIAIVIVIIGFLAWKRLKDKRKYQRTEKVIDKIKQSGLENDVKKFIGQFGSGLIDKEHDWEYGKKHFSRKRMDYFRDTLKKERGIELDNSELEAVLTSYIDELERDFTSKLISTPENLINKKLDDLSGEDLETLLEKLYVKMGYTVKHEGRTGDQGVDLVAVRGEEKLAIQAKKRSINESLGNDAIQQVFSGKDMYGCNEAVIITTSPTLTREAIEAARAHGVKLIHRPLLQEMLLKNLGESWV